MWVLCSAQTSDAEQTLVCATQKPPMLAMRSPTCSTVQASDDLRKEEEHDYAKNMLAHIWVRPWWKKKNHSTLMGVLGHIVVTIREWYCTTPWYMVTID